MLGGRGCETVAPLVQNSAAPPCPPGPLPGRIVGVGVGPSPAAVAETALAGLVSPGGVALAPPSLALSAQPARSASATSTATRHAPDHRPRRRIVPVPASLVATCPSQYTPGVQLSQHLTTDAKATHAAERCPSHAGRRHSEGSPIEGSWYDKGRRYGTADHLLHDEKRRGRREIWSVPRAPHAP